jgi:hypothetical protein
MVDSDAPTNARYLRTGHLSQYPHCNLFNNTTFMLFIGIYTGDRPYKNEGQIQYSCLAAPQLLSHHLFSMYFWRHHAILILFYPSMRPTFGRLEA